MEVLGILFVLVLALAVPVGAVMGMIAFTRARRALEQVAALQRELAALRAGIPPGLAPAAAAAPDAQAIPAEEPAPIAEPTPEDLPEWVRARAPGRGSVPATPPPLPVPAEPVAGEASVAAAAPPPEPPRRRMDLEELLTLKWGVWLGGAALLLAGVFLVRYAVEEELLGPAARCVLAAVLGATLIGAGEWLARRGTPLPSVPWPDHAPAALAAGGVAVLFAAAYGAGPYFGLVPEFIGFVLLAAVSLAGLALALRFGQLVGAIGIVGAFVTPALVQTDAPSIPGLFAYLLFVTACALAVVRLRAWVWLGWSSTLAAAFWVVIGAVASSAADAWAPGLFVAAAAALNLFLLPAAALEFAIGRALVWIPYATLGTVGLILYLVHPGWATRIGVLLLIPLAIGKGAREPRLARLPWLSVLFFLGTLLFWALPAWNPTGEVVATQEMIQAILPGGWAPEVIQPLLITAALIAALYAAAGLWQERAAPHPLIWCALAAAVPPLTLGVTYAQVERFQTRPLWAVCAAILALAQTYAAQAARREDVPSPLQRAGIHAAGAVASLALGCAMVLGEQWLTLAFALFLPALAVIEERAALPALRRVALAVAALVLIRLLLNWYVLDYAFGAWPVVNLLLLTYGMPAACFTWAALHFRRRGDDLAVAVLEAGAAAFVTVLVALEIRHLAHGGDLARPASTFLEWSLHASALGVLGLVFLRLGKDGGRAVLRWAGALQGGLGLFIAALLLLANPMFGDARIDGPPLLNDLLIAYILPAGLAAFALRQAEIRAMPALAKALGCYALVAVFVWITAEIRHQFHPGRMNLLLFGPPVTDAELWAWSGGWLAYGIALMVGGIRAGSRALRLAALAVVGITALKVFLIDMDGLTGLWRVLSFLGLGLTLIGLGAVFRRFVATGKPPDPPIASAPDPAASR